MSDKEEFLNRLKKMPAEELVKYENAALFIGRCVNVLGVSCILFALFYPYMAVIFTSIIFTIILAQVSAGVGEFRTAVKDYLSSKDK